MLVEKMKKIKIARIVTVPIVYTHILDLLSFLDGSDQFELHLICSEGPYLSDLRLKFKNSIIHIIPISREINLKSDLASLWRLYELFRKEKFDIIHSHTPKAGLISSMAGFLSMIRIRLHTFTGQVWVNLSGPKKSLLILLDRLITFLNTMNYTDSFGQKKFLMEHGVGNEKSLAVIHKGSLGGINAERFSPEKLHQKILDKKGEIFPDYNGKILLYLGRINKDKGLRELWEAFKILHPQHRLQLLLVGPVETLDDVNFKILIEEMQKSPDVKFINFTSEPEVYLGLCDIFCFPSYREGFGTVALEASAMEKPVVASNIYGLSEAVEDRKSGLLFEVYNSQDLSLKLEELITNENFAKDLGRYGRERVLIDFTDRILTEKMIAEYFRLIKKYE